MSLSHAEFARREHLKRLRKVRAENAPLASEPPCRWTARYERPKGKGFRARGRDGRVFSIGEVHGGGWVALVYGVRGATLAAKDFYGPRPQAEARAWCEAQWGDGRDR